MTIDLRRSLCALVLTGFVAACGGGGGAGGKSAEWAVDACKTFPAEAAGKAAGVAVAKAEGSAATSNEQVTVSNCTYSSADGKDNFGVLLRQDKVSGQTVDQQLAGVTSQPDVTGSGEPVAMPKGKAVWMPKMRTLSYVPEGERMIVVTPPGAITFGQAPVPEAEVKAKAIAIATAIEG